MEITNSSINLRIYGDRLSMISASQVTFYLGCQYKKIWEVQRESYSPFKIMDDTELLICVINYANYKYPMHFSKILVNYIDILMPGVGTREASNYSNRLKVE